jgi:hypothetical protein
LRRGGWFWDIVHTCIIAHVFVVDTACLSMEFRNAVDIPCVSDMRRVTRLREGAQTASTVNHHNMYEQERTSGEVSKQNYLKLVQITYQRVQTVMRP